MVKLIRSYLYFYIPIIALKLIKYISYQPIYPTTFTR